MFPGGREIPAAPNRGDGRCAGWNNRGQVVSSDRLFYDVWGEKYYSSNNNTIMVHIRHLREKMNDSSEKPKYIKTVWGVGYKIE